MALGGQIKRPKLAQRRCVIFQGGKTMPGFAVFWAGFWSVLRATPESRRKQFDTGRNRGQRIKAQCPIGPLA